MMTQLEQRQTVKGAVQVEGLSVTFRNRGQDIHVLNQIQLGINPNFSPAMIQALNEAEIESKLMALDERRQHLVF